MFPELRALQIEVPGDVVEMLEGGGEAPAHEAGGSRGGTRSTNYELSTRVSLKTHELRRRVQIRTKNAQVESMAKYGKIEGVIGEPTLFRSATKRLPVLLMACFRADHYTLVRERGLKWQGWIGQSVRPLKVYLAK